MTHSARRLVDDLLNVEVDIIVDDDLGQGTDSATMSSVVERYGTWLADHVPAIDARWRSFSPTERDLEAVARARLDAALVGATGIDAASGDAAGDGEGAAGVLRDAAVAEARCRILVASDPPADSGWLPVLRRIRGTVEQFATLPPNAGAPSVDEVRIVRKAAELGTATISAQSVAQLDGDIVIRADEGSFLTPEWLALRELHAHAVACSLAHWRVLIDFAAQVTIGAAGLATTIARAIRNPVSTARRWNNRRKDNVQASGRTVGELLKPAVLCDTWREFARIREELLDDGGITVESPGEVGEHEPPLPVFARTVIQPDGDALWFVRTDAASDSDLLEQHASRVAAVYERRGAVVATLQRYLSAIQSAISALVATVGAVLAVVLADGFTTLVGFAVTAAASTIGVSGVRGAIGWAMRRGLRTTMS
jgi:hypothetical protein